MSTSTAIVKKSFEDAFYGAFDFAETLGYDADCTDMAEMKAAFLETFSKPEPVECSRVYKIGLFHSKTLRQGMRMELFIKRAPDGKFCAIPDVQVA